MNGRRARGATARPPARLLRLHQHSLSNLLVLGGTAVERLAVAQAFHRASPLRRAAFLALDCGHQESLVSKTLQLWLSPEDGPPGGAPPCCCGTLFLDSVGCLSARTQRHLLALARRIQCDPPELPAGSGAIRLAVGNAEALDQAVAERSFSGALYDCLDKIRVELGEVPRRGAA